MNAEQVKLVESLCSTKYSTQDTALRQAAEAQLEPFTKIDGVPHLKRLLEVSNEGPCLVFASSNLLNIVTKFWPQIKAEDKLDLHQWLLSLIPSRGVSIPDRHVLVSIIRVLCRVTKLGWLEDPRYRQLASEILNSGAITSNNFAQVIVVLTLFGELVQELNIHPNIYRRLKPTQQLQIRDSFRDNELLVLFHTSLTVLETFLATYNPQNNTPTCANDDPRVCQQALILAHHCLSFQFAGLGWNDTIDENTVFIPRTWHDVVADPETLKLFWNLYGSLPPPISTDCLKCLVQFAGTTCSLFSYDEYKQWLRHILFGTRLVLQKQQGLDDVQNYQQFCRLLSRFPVTKQLAELLHCQDFCDWVEWVAQFAIQSFMRWPATHKCHFHLLTLWTRIAPCDAEHVQRFAGEVIQAFIRSRMDLVYAVIRDPGVYEDDLTDPNPDKVLEQVEAAAELVKISLFTTGPFILSLTTPLIADLIKSTQSSKHESFGVLEGQLSWLLYIVGCVISPSEATRDDQAILHAEFIVCAMQMLQPSHSRAASMMQSTTTDASNEHLASLEHALLYFIRGLSKHYLCDAQQDGTAVVFARLKDSGIAGLGNRLEVVGFILNHLVSNLKTWKSSSSIISETLSLLSEVYLCVQRHGASQELNVISQLLSNHADFLDGELATNYRSRYYETLSSIFFLKSRETSDFQKFMTPIQNICSKLEEIQDPLGFVQNEVRNAIIGVARDIRGVMTACTNRNTYDLLFNWIFPSKAELFKRLCQICSRDWEVSIPVLRCLSEILNNSRGRIFFDTTSVNGVVLFREAAAWAQYHGNCWLELSVIKSHLQEEQIYQQKYKRIGILMTLMSRALAVDFCHIALMEFYNDNALSGLRELAMKISCALSLDELLQYPKLASSYFALVESLFRKHCNWLVNSSEPGAFLNVVRKLLSVIKSIELRNQDALGQACTALGHLVTFFFTELKMNSSKAARLSQIFQAYPDFFTSLAHTIFNFVFFEECPLIEQMSPIVLSLILLNPRGFLEYRSQLIATSAVASDVAASVLKEAFNSLLDGFEHVNSLDISNTELFYTRIVTLRKNAPAVLLSPTSFDSFSTSPTCTPSMPRSPQPSPIRLLPPVSPNLLRLS